LVPCSPSGVVISMAISSKKERGCLESHSRQFEVFFSSYKDICPVIFPRTSHWSNPCMLSMQKSFANWTMKPSPLGLELVIPSQ
jgi:hypothetical protein